MDDGAETHNEALFSDVTGLIEGARNRAARAVNSELVLLYWSIGKRIREELLSGARAEYGKQVVRRLAQYLTDCYGRGYTYGNLTRMCRFAECYPESRIVAPLAQQLTWTNLTMLLAISDSSTRDFYSALAARERWSKRTLRERIDSKLYERTLVAGGSIETPLSGAALSDGAPGTSLVFRDPYVLDFLGLPSEHSEADLERAILSDMQSFLLELGAGFAFVARQKRIIVDGEDYYLDLLFYHIHLRRYVAIELKTRPLRPGDKGQIELYLAWLDANVRTPADESSLGLILCTHKGEEQVRLLGLDVGDIRAAKYLTRSMFDAVRNKLQEAAGTGA